MWRVEPEWAGEVCVILAGGPSARSQDLSLLEGRKVIAINSAWETWPGADILFFADKRWYADWGFGKEVERSFGGRVVTASNHRFGSGSILRLRKDPPPGLSTDPSRVKMRHTSIAGAIGLARHLGVRGIAGLGLDGKFAADGRRHHHDARYRSPPAKDWSQLHCEELRCLKEPLEQAGIRVINASPGSAWDVWPIMNLDEALASLDGEPHA